MQKLRFFTLFLAFFLGSISLNAQCAMYFTGTVGFTETCAVSGTAGPYSITVAPHGTDSISITGLWELPQAIVYAGLDCNNLSFSFTRQPMDNFYGEGTGARSGNSVAINYTMYDTDSVTVLESCTGSYPAPFVSTTTAIPGEDVQIAPQPMRDHSWLILPEALTPQDLTLELVNLRGQVVRRMKSLDDHRIRLERGTLSEGVYFYRMSDGKAPVASGKLLVR